VYTLSPATVARDYLAIADAAGADRFAYYGYSWGAVTGLQLAIRTGRLTALVSGGFPMIGGPYRAMRTLCRTIERTALRIEDDGAEPTKDWLAYGSSSVAEIRGFASFYDALRGFADRDVQGRITCPRLCFGGTADVEMLEGRVLFSGGKLIADHGDEMRRAGWEVQMVQGKDHAGAAAPDVAAPLVRAWLDTHWNA